MAGLNSWLKALEKRKQLLESGEFSNCRLIHSEVKDLRCDLYGDVCWFYWYNPQKPTKKDLLDIEKFTAETGASKWHVHSMLNRGASVGEKVSWSSEEFTEWIAKEGDAKYILKNNQGLSPGLFLDQRNNRAWIREQAKDKKVLNLFSYTGSFGIAAMLGGADSVVNVDTSKRTLNWAEDNANLNSFKVNYVHMDAREFLRMTKRQEKKFDIVICDPPSFARNKSGIFKIEKDLPLLTKSVSSVLNGTGIGLISTNFEKWDQSEFESILVRGIKALNAELVPTPQISADFTCTENSTIQMKSIAIWLKN